ncbi:MAG: hypothetical protein ACFFB3_22410 [Candidatus Hodarchaeota archaeon]
MDRDKALFILSVDKGQNFLADFNLFHSMAEQLLMREVSKKEFDGEQIWGELRGKISTDVISQAKKEIGE